MSPSEITPPPATNSPKIDTSEVRKVSFWVSQICVIIATVLGVFLAAHEGFKQALAYGDIQSDKNNYYLRKSLQAEITDNIVLVKEYMKKIERGGVVDRQTAFKLDTFVWDSLKFSSGTLETPSDLLGPCRRFYRDVADIQGKVASNDYTVKKATLLLQELIDQMEKDTLPKFQNNTDELKVKLDALNVKV